MGVGRGAGLLTPYESETIMTPQSSAFLRYNPNVEVIQPQEEDDIAAIREIFTELRTYAFDKHRHGLRDAHAKSHGIVRGLLRIHEELPGELRQGLFAQPRDLPAIIRFSTAPGDIAPDGIGAACGMAIKVLDVDGQKVLPGSARTQDFLLVNHPTISSGDVHTYRRDQALLLKAQKAPEEAQIAVTSLLRAGAKLLRSVGIVKAGGPAGQAKPHTHLLGESYYSQGALRFGDHVAKIAAVPVSANLIALTGQHVPVLQPSALRDHTSQFFASGQGRWEIRAQLATELSVTPIEDASVDWPQDVTPYRTVATLIVDPQISYSPERRVYADDDLSFNPWHCLLEHQPLGSIQRVRKPVYDDSDHDRHRLNARPRREPNTIDDLPA
jgi:hypothetical protein